MSKPLNIASDFIVMNADFKADAVAVTDDLYARLEQTYGDFAGRSLIPSHSFEGDWPTWEVHPEGDEIVVLLAGSAEMVLANEDGDEVVSLVDPGQIVIVPRGTWHTARISEPTRMLFITPGEGTRNAEQPVRGCVE